MRRAPLAGHAATAQGPAAGDHRPGLPRPGAEGSGVARRGAARPGLGRGYLDDIGAAAGELAPARDALVALLERDAPDGLRDWWQAETWSQPLRHAYLARAARAEAEALEDLAATLFDLSAILHQARDRDIYRRWAPRVVLEEIDEACLELAELEDDLLPIRALVMAAHEATEDEPASPPKPDSLKGDPTMPDETRDRDEAQPRQTADLRPERLGHTAELRPERLGQTGQLRPERLGEPLSVAQVEERIGELGEDWTVEGDRERLTLRRSFPFVPAAALFVLQVTLEVGVFEGFMPDVRMDNLEVEVGVSSSAHGRLTDHDFELARKLDSL